MTAHSYHYHHRGVPRFGSSGRYRHQKGTPRVRWGRRRRQCEGVDDEDGGRADFADAELTDDVREVAAATVARILETAAIPAGEEGGGGGGIGSAGATGWLSRSLTLCRRHLLSSRCAAACCQLTLPLLFASCMPPLSFPLVCQLVVASPLLSRRHPLRLATLPRPLLCHQVVPTRNTPLVAPLPPLDL